MLNPWLRLLATHPHRLVEHAEAYAGLAACEARTASAAWARRALLYGVAAAGLVLTAMLGGVALMLCAVVAPAQMPAPWVLLVVPAVPAGVALISWLMVRSRSDAPMFADLRRQLQADVSMLREEALP